MSDYHLSQLVDITTIMVAVEEDETIEILMLKTATVVFVIRLKKCTLARCNVDISPQFC